MKIKEIQTLRFNNISDVYSNAMMPLQLVKEISKTNEAGKKIHKKAMEKLDLSTRSYVTGS